MSTKKQNKSNWIVRMKCEVLKDVYCENCTEQEARDNPFEYSTDEQEVDQTDYTVQGVEENV